MSEIVFYDNLSLFVVCNVTTRLPFVLSYLYYYNIQHNDYHEQIGITKRFLFR